VCKLAGSIEIWPIPEITTKTAELDEEIEKLFESSDTLLSEES